MKRASHLYEKLISDENLLAAINEVNKTHHWKRGHRPNQTTVWIELTKKERVCELRQIIEVGFEPKEPRYIPRFDVCAGKMREIHEPAQWPDQYVHHALIQVLKPVMMRGMDFYCCGSIPGRGQKRGMDAIKRWMRNPKKTKYELTCDIRHFYDSLMPKVVMDRMRCLVKDHRLLAVAWRVVQGGILIGAYTSQWCANAVLQPMDQMIRQSGLCAHYVRYMDNITIFGPNKRKLRKLRQMIADWLGAQGLELKGDWQIFPVRKDIPKGRLKQRIPDAVGFRYGRGFTLPRKKNLLRLKQAVAKYRKRGWATAEQAQGILARIGQLKHCSNCQIYARIFRGERLQHRLKKSVRKAARKDSEWSTYLARKVYARYCAQKVAATHA